MCRVLGSLFVRAVWISLNKQALSSRSEQHITRCSDNCCGCWRWTILSLPRTMLFQLLHQRVALAGRKGEIITSRIVSTPCSPKLPYVIIVVHELQKLVEQCHTLRKQTVGSKLCQCGGGMLMAQVLGDCIKARQKGCLPILTEANGTLRIVKVLMKIFTRAIWSAKCKGAVKQLERTTTYPTSTCWPDRIDGQALCWPHCWLSSQKDVRIAYRELESFAWMSPFGWQ